MSYLAVGFLCLLVGLVVGFLIGKKNGQRLANAAGTLKDTIGRL